jgi:hypothetical protein
LAFDERERLPGHDAFLKLIVGNLARPCEWKMADVVDGPRLILRAGNRIGLMAAEAVRDQVAVGPELEAVCGPLAAHVHLSNAAGRIAVPFEVLGDREEFRADRRVVAHPADVVRQAPGPHADPRRRTERELAVGVLELRRSGCEPVQALRASDPISSETGDLGIVLVREQEQHVRPALHVLFPYGSIHYPGGPILLRRTMTALCAKEAVRSTRQGESAC